MYTTQVYSMLQYRKFICKINENNTVNAIWITDSYLALVHKGNTDYNFLKEIMVLFNHAGYAEA